MDLVVDATILFTGLTGKGITKDIIFLESVSLHCPEALFKEIEEHKSRIKYISTLPSSDLEFLLNKFKAKIKTFPLYKYDLFLKEANNLMPDPDDTEYLALSLALDKCPIWSEDPHFKKQSVVRVFTTKELVELLRTKKLF